jgi:asparagine synthetase B (glutamine-hydrolysing)
VAAIQLLPLEIASGLVLGETQRRPELVEPASGMKPIAALEQALLPTLRRSPCLVSFSGGLDSSAILAVATNLASREGLEAPVPITVRFPGDPEAHESSWQELVVRELGIGDWQRIEAGEDLGVLGPVARAAIGRHGLLWPPNIHVLIPLLEAASGGWLITGLGGDELFAGLPRLRRALLPSAVRRARARRGALIGLPWLRPTAGSALRSAFAAQEAGKPVRWKPWVAWVARRRQLELLKENGEGLALDAGTRLVHPFLDLRFLGAIARHGSRPRQATRATVLNALVEGLVPKAVLARTEKADFTRALWGDEAREFAATWNGEGLPGELVDAGRLRQMWAADPPDFRSATALQAAWLAAAPSGA